jgi:predicted nucleic acid-binding protein
MTFAAIPSGESVYLDANVFVYWLGPDPKFGNACADLAERVEKNDVVAYISANDLSDVAHRLMTLEACATFGIPYAGVAKRLRRKPDDVRQLVRFRRALDTIAKIGVRILDDTGSDVANAGDASRLHGLLSADGLIVALMRKHGLTAMASNDVDFDRVPGIVRYSPI